MNPQEEQEFISRLQKYKHSQPSQNFKVATREKLHQTIASRQQSGDARLIKPLTFFTLMKKFILPIAVLAVVALGTTYWYTNNAGTNKALITLNSDNKLLPGKYSVTEVDQNSFGDLDKVSIIQGENQKRTQSGGGNAGTATGMGGGYAGVSMAESPKMAAPQGDTSIYPPYGDTYRFVYEGDKIQDLASMQGVLKRLKPQQDQDLVSRIIQMFSFGLTDMSRFTNPRIQNFSFIEDKEYGMGLNVDLNYGSVNIYQNYEKWPQQEYKCDGSYCGTFPRIKESDVPTDDQAIAIAKQFINDYKISLEGYGNAMVYDYATNWRVLYAAEGTDKANFIFPDTVNVVFPLVLDGKEVMDESGNPTGIYITIDVRSKRVSSLYGLETKQYEKSDYVGEKDLSRIMKIAERGGYHGSVYDNAARVVNLHLDTPTVEMVKIWYTTDYTKPGQDLYVPALVFPIKDWQKNNYWRKNIIVPLVKDILDNENPSGPIPMNTEGTPAANVKGAVVEDKPAVQPEQAAQ
jgi:hypothetical protein